MSNNWYSTEISWYTPLERPQADSAPDPKELKRRRRRRFVALVTALAILLGIGAGTVFALRGREVVQLPQSSPEKPAAPEKGEKDEEGEGGWKELPPESAEDFFANYYDEIQTDVANIDLPRVKYIGSYSPALSEGGGGELSLQELYEGCARSIVGIRSYLEDEVAYGWGTGVILSDDGLVLTNTHVVDEGKTVKVILADDSEHEAKLVGADAISDIALLKIEAKGLEAAELGDSSSLRVGDRVAAIGNPLGEDFRSTLTDGIISAIARDINYNGHSLSLLQTNTAINEGNSGGALFNMQGQVIGITNMKMMGSYSSIEGIGFAIPSTTVVKVTQALIRDGVVRGRPSVGITVGPIPEYAMEQYGLPGGLYVSEVSKGSDAEEKGILPGDVVTHVNGIEVKTTADVQAIKDGMAVGDVMEIRIWRNGETLDFEIVLMDTNDIYG